MPLGRLGGDSAATPPAGPAARRRDGGPPVPLRLGPGSLLPGSVRARRVSDGEVAAFADSTATGARKVPAVDVLDVNGASLAYEVSGDGRCVVFVHGTGTHRLTFGPVVDALPAAMKCVTYDRRGFGSSRGAIARRMDQHADDLAALVQHVSSEPATIVAQSGGAVVALQLAARRPELVRRLILAEPVVHLALTPSLSALGGLAAVYGRRVIGRKEEAVVGFYQWASHRADGTNGYDPSPEEWQDIAVQHSDAVFRELRQMIVPIPSTRTIRAVACPATLVIGDVGQPVFHRTTRRVGRLLPRAATIDVADSGHLIAMDQPAAFAAVVAKLVAM